MKNLVTFILVIIGFQLNAFTGNQLSKEEYVNKWSRIAVEQMMQYNIPASITLAQGILESASGNSDLAQKANNHFGIKCHDWKGEKYFKDDDEKNACFRVYNSAEESFLDHSLFLAKRERYAKLFTYKITDYKAWAHGLKDAGYATNPKYPQLLIDLIENLHLDQFDQANSNDLVTVADLKKTGSKSKEDSKQSVVIDQKSSASAHTVYAHGNKVKYVVVKKGDTFYRIAQEFNLSLNQLYRYNDFDEKKDLLEVGDIVNVQPKKGKAKDKNKIVTQQKSYAQIAQEEGVKLKSLLKLNNLEENTSVKKGEKVILR